MDGHFDFGKLLPRRSTSIRISCFATLTLASRSMLEVLPAAVLDESEVVCQSATGRALAHTVGGSRTAGRSAGADALRALPGHSYRAGLSRFYRQQIASKKILLVDDVRNTGQTLARCATLVRATGGTVIATAEIYDRMESIADAGAPNYALAEYKAPEIYSTATCPLCQSGVPVTTFYRQAEPHIQFPHSQSRGAYLLRSAVSG